MAPFVFFKRLINMLWIMSVSVGNSVECTTASCDEIMSYATQRLH